MPWTDEQKLSHLLGLPWTIVLEAGDDPGEIRLRVRELPSVIATGAGREEVEADFWEALRATLECYLHFGDAVPRPDGVRLLPWERDRRTAPNPAITMRQERAHVAHVAPIPETALQHSGVQEVAALTR